MLVGSQVLCVMPGVQEMAGEEGRVLSGPFQGFRVYLCSKVGALKVLSQGWCQC